MSQRNLYDPATWSQAGRDQVADVLRRAIARGETNVPHSHGASRKVCRCSNFRPTEQQVEDHVRLEMLKSR